MSFEKLNSSSRLITVAGVVQPSSVGKRSLTVRRLAFAKSNLKYARLTKEVVHKVPSCRLLSLVAKYQHVSSTFACAKFGGQFRERKSGVVLYRINHAGKASICGHLDVDEVSGPVSTSLVVHGGVESDGFRCEEFV
jgi:hypothetical protein